MGKTATRKRDVHTGSKPFAPAFEGSDAHAKRKGSENIKLLDRTVADAQVYDDMERNFERVR